MTTTLLDESFVSFSCRRLARRAARCITCVFLFTTTCLLRRLLNCPFVSPADNMPAVPLTESLVSFSRRRHTRRAARCIARFFLFSTPCPSRRSLNRSFLSPADNTPAVTLAKSLVSFSFRRLAHRAAR
jgi:hypothetical protein